MAIMDPDESKYNLELRAFDSMYGDINKHDNRPDEFFIELHVTDNKAEEDKVIRIRADYRMFIDLVKDLHQTAWELI